MNPASTPTRTRRKRNRIDREASLAKILTPLEAYVTSTAEAADHSDTPKSEKRVSQRTLLDALTKLQKQQTAFEGALHMSMLELTKHVVSDDCDEDDEDERDDSPALSPILVSETQQPALPGTLANPKTAQAKDGGLFVKMEGNLKTM